MVNGLCRGSREPDVAPRENRGRATSRVQRIGGLHRMQSAVGTRMKEYTRTADGNQSQSKQARQAYGAPGWPLSSPMHSQIDLDSARRVCEAEVEMEQIETGWITPAMAGDDPAAETKDSGQGRLKGQSNCTIASQGEGEGMQKRGERKKEKMFGFERALNDLEVGTIF
ncbi:hypothetical protein K438DRAFT_1760042 [Mycena galopus ATCC 62051]|nr:hypothetical protein K438DRAFT_1760042 [Mycena galopus ATCC 62051]